MTTTSPALFRRTCRQCSGGLIYRDGVLICGTCGWPVALDEPPKQSDPAKVPAASAKAPAASQDTSTLTSPPSPPPLPVDTRTIDQQQSGRRRGRQGEK